MRAIIAEHRLNQEALPAEEGPNSNQPEGAEGSGAGSSKGDGGCVYRAETELDLMARIS